MAGTTGIGADVRVFKGIPFAAPPVGSLRWRGAAAGRARWEGVRQDRATLDPVVCRLGREAFRRTERPKTASQPMNEDCLYLNVWTAAASASDRRPVLVWSHGGAFRRSALGSLPQFDGEALARKGVVFVTHNYRLGPFGFFAHPELTKESGRNASGNYAMMDLIAVLQWVRKEHRGVWRRSKSRHDHGPVGGWVSYAVA